MKKFLFTTVAIAALGAALPVDAADFAYRAPYRTAPYAAPLYNWTGFYIGAHAGGAFSSSDNFTGLGTGNNGNGRFVGGLQAGGDWQFAPNWVAGAEAQYSWVSGNVGAIFPGGFAYTNNQRGLGSITGRVGYTWGPGLLYVKGGYAYSDNNEAVTAFGVPVAFATDADHKNGYTVGLLIGGVWVEGIVAANDGTGIVLECLDGGHVVAKIEHVAAVRVMSETPVRTPLTSRSDFDVEAMPMPGPQPAYA